MSCVCRDHDKPCHRKPAKGRKICSGCKYYCDPVKQW